MKTKNLPGRIVRLAMLMALMLIVVISCKKKDDTPTPPTPGPTPPATPDVFSNKPLQMMSDYEIANHLDFPGHIINRFGRGIVGGEDPEIPNPLKAIGKTLWEVHDYIHTEKRFDQIDDGIKEIEGQISQLQQQMAALAAQLSVDVSELEQFMTGGVISGYITNINGVMDSTTHNGFGYFPMEGRKYQAGQITQQQMNIDTGYARTFANNVFNKASGYDVCTWSEQLNAQICPNVGGSQTNALTTYANLLLQKVTPLGLNDSASMMKAYLLLENYFLQIVNYQFQCVTVWSNACNFYDTSGYQANLYYTGTFQKNIKQEIDAYFSAVGYLAINLNDYRSTANALADLQYVQTGLKPDNLFIHILARAQFLANLYYDALGLNYPVMCGTVITPKNYAIEHGSVVDSITFSIAGKNLSSTATNTKNGGVGLEASFHILHG
ncbi:MAG: hypothetical protein WCR01_14880 [Bacteroidota bacterium]